MSRTADRPALPAQDAPAVLGRHLARLLARLGGGGAQEDVEIAARCLTASASAGHVCVDLGAESAALGRDYRGWSAALRASGVVGAPGDRRPLVLDAAGRLYLYRYWQYEHRLGEDLRRRAAILREVDESRLRSGLARLFSASGQDTDWQKVAAAVAVLRGLCVISGGPGTGKTTTVVRILALLGLLADETAGGPLRIGLAAPTGKAAARMQEAIRGERDKLDIPAAIRQSIPEKAGTLHRLLGGTPDSTRFRFHRDRPLPLDVLVVDEASMVDLALMAKLADALPPAARLILIGDKDQLASVEAGAVLSDLCARENRYSRRFADCLASATGHAVPTVDAPASPMADATILLERSYRFRAASGIGRFAAAVREGGAADALAMLEDRGRYEDLHWQPLASPATDAFAERIVRGLEEYVEAVRAGAGPAEVIAAFNRFRVLTAHRGGPYGVGTLNHLVERILMERGLLPHARQAWYPGRPIMVSRNHYGLRLFNGDTGVVLRGGADRALRVHFQNADGSLRSFAPARLPAHDTAFVLTVHKAQGSEFDRVVLMLPDRPTPVLTRELLYTAVTRARLGVEIWGRREIIEAAVRRRSQRNSGLRDALWPPADREAGIPADR